MHRALPLSALLAALLLAGCATTDLSAPPATTPPPATSAQPPAAGTTPAQAAEQQQRFAQWLAGFKDSARAAGINDGTLRALDGAQYLPRVVELDRAQPEFTRAPWQYLDNTVSPQRVAQGQQMLQQWRAPLDAAAARYGVPPEIVVAIWGMESNYGGNYGNTPTLSALATLGFDGRREAWARGELLAALKIIQAGDIDAAHMIGSWAGAMGQTQFMPSAFASYAVDGDGDGRRDIWGSMPDVIASTANFLARSGWQAGQAWGAEVRLPQGFDYGRADPGIRQSSAQWEAEGVRSFDGQALPPLAEASLFLPAGARGPAFVIGPNFRAILRYNNSTNYALAVGLLAQRIAGGPGVQAPWPRELAPLSRSQVREMQEALNAGGFDAGTPDGVMGPATRSAVRRFQQKLGLPADGYPSVELLDRLRAP
ncbi:lytic murein transglycosylase [Variovorax sp. OV329]|uniref:lytic murein transglycosylase n=1 Tax=Variovorax sp. OV329 TaxID=1882825 RepID=UPI0008F14D34|nr:lytic murein transglycosylase [Variovorax sp. OV329]SFL90079.1 membrane-bound lytic murein transglycosylase B [Variovorax sp. OV329]